MSASYYPKTKECKVGCIDGKGCKGQKCRGCRLPEVWKQLPYTNKTSEECSNSYGLKGILYKSEPPVEFCFDGETPIYAQLGTGDKKVRYEVKKFTNSPPSADVFVVPDYCKCPKQNPFELLNRH